jgi:TonB family protein
MRSKMLGLAIALSTFGLGVAATTIWIAYHTPEAQRLEAPLPSRVAEVGAVEIAPREAAPCLTANSDSTSTKRSLPVDTTISGGSLNGRAISKPAPVYPPIARAARASGSVIVQVKVDECGNVVSAKALSGHPLLQMAAVRAAYEWRFSPTYLSGEPVKVSGTVTFNFLLQ